ncbi:MAG: BON domain-containing protein [Gemmatimonadota bacterium]|nr:BON domain-containing protein [Gemmatimonadota bacterium]
MEAAIGVRDAWEGNGTSAEEPDDEVEDDEDVGLEDEDAEEDDVDDEFEDESDDEDDEDDEDDDEDDEEEEEEEEDDVDDDEDDDDEDEDDDLDDEEIDDSADDADAPALDARVLEAFTNDPVLADQDVEIEQVPGDAIVLHGEVRRAREVAHAVTIARGVPGVAAVRQRLTVRNRR